MALETQQIKDAQEPANHGGAGDYMAQLVADQQKEQIDFRQSMGSAAAQAGADSARGVAQGLGGQLGDLPQLDLVEGGNKETSDDHGNKNTSDGASKTTSDGASKSAGPNPGSDSDGSNPSRPGNSSKKLDAGGSDSEVCTPDDPRGDGSPPVDPLPLGMTMEEFREWFRKQQEKRRQADRDRKGS